MQVPEVPRLVPARGDDVSSCGCGLRPVGGDSVPRVPQTLQEEGVSWPPDEGGISRWQLSKVSTFWASPIAGARRSFHAASAQGLQRVPLRSCGLSLELGCSQSPCLPLTCTSSHVGRGVKSTGSGAAPKPYCFLKYRPRLSDMTALYLGFLKRERG